MIEFSKDYLFMMADYNRWANERLFNACGVLSADAWHLERGSFFPSLHNTLNHIWVGDNLWMARFQLQPKPDYQLDSVPFADFDSLWQARQTFDQVIIDFANDIDEARLAGMLEYFDSGGNRHYQPLSALLAHFFNHQSHHRGQAHVMLHQETGDAPPLDLVYYRVWQGDVSG